jgi:hypothetical protein
MPETLRLEESAARADELEAAGDENGAAVWRRITAAVVQLANNTPPGRMHRLRSMRFRHRLHKSLTIGQIPEHA